MTPIYRHKDNCPAMGKDYDNKHYYAQAPQRKGLAPYYCKHCLMWVRPFWEEEDQWFVRLHYPVGGADDDGLENYFKVNGY